MFRPPFRFRFPFQSEDELVGPILAKVTPRTRLALLDHVTSQTGLVLPIQRIVRELVARGIEGVVQVTNEMSLKK